jgi:hypothetical protein
LGVHECHQGEHLSRIDPANGRITVGGKTYLATSNQKLTGLYEPATVIPPGSQQVCLFAGYAIGDGKPKFFGNLQSLFPGINRRSKYADTQFCERGTAFFISSQKADAEGSPVASIEQHNGEVGMDIPRKCQGASVCQVQCQVWKIVTCR